MSEKPFTLKHVPEAAWNGSKFFVPGRTAMTCCADDTTFLGYICKSAFAPKIAEGQWWMLLRRLRLRREWNIRERESYFTQSM